MVTEALQNTKETTELIIVCQKKDSYWERKGMWQPSHFRNSWNHFKGKTAHAHRLEQTQVTFFFFLAIHLSRGQVKMVN